MCRARVPVCLRVCARVSACVCLRACVCARVPACLRVRVCLRACVPAAVPVTIEAIPDACGPRTPSAARDWLLILCFSSAFSDSS